MTAPLLRLRRRAPRVGPASIHDTTGPRPRATVFCRKSTGVTPPTPPPSPGPRALTLARGHGGRWVPRPGARGLPGLAGRIAPAAFRGPIPQRRTVAATTHAPYPFGSRVHHLRVRGAWGGFVPVGCRLRRLGRRGNRGGLAVGPTVYRRKPEGAGDSEQTPYIYRIESVGYEKAPPVGWTGGARGLPMFGGSRPGRRPHNVRSRPARISRAATAGGSNGGAWIGPTVFEAIHAPISSRSGGSPGPCGIVENRSNR